MIVLRDAWFIARKDVQYLLRRRETMVWTFVMPVLFFYFIGTITGNFGGGGKRQDSLAVVAHADAGFLLDQLEMRLREQDYAITAVDPGDDEQIGSFSRRLFVPRGFTASVLAGEQVTLRLLRRGQGLGADYDRIRVGRAVYTLLADIVVTGEEGEALSAKTLERLNATPRALTLEVSPAGERKKIPTGFEQAIPGTMVMFTLLVLLTSGAVLLVGERKEGLLRRLASTPIEKRSVVLGKWGGRMALGMVQIGFAMVAGTLMFGMDWGPNLPMVLVALFVYAGLVAGLGILLGSLARTEGQVIGLGVVSANVLAALGGCWWPIEVTPAWMQSTSVFLPTGLAMNILHRLVSFGAPPTSVIPQVLIMAAAGLVVGWLAVRAFRYQ